MAFNFGHQRNEHGKTAGLDRKEKRRLKKEQKERDAHLFVRDNALRDAVPRGGYEFHSNYFQYGKRFGRILTLIPDDQADRKLIPFWKVLLIPQSRTLNDAPNETADGAVHGAHGQLFDMLENKTKKWTTDHQASSDSAGEMEADSTDGARQQHRVGTRRWDNMIIADDIASGDMYGATEYKVMITARSLHDLDVACSRYHAQIANNFDGIHFEVYEGQQRLDFHNLLRTADVQVGDHPMATSSEYAGGYEILTRGITDPNGDYIGQMVGDVNNTAVLMDLDNYDERVILGHSAQPAMLRVSPDEFDVGTRATTLLGVRLAQAALINNHRVVHMVLNNAVPQDIGADLSDITTVVSLNHGAVNPFEMFGDKKDELTIFPAHVEKLRLMIKQISPSVDDIDLNEVFTNIVQRFYEDQRMYVPNPEQNRDALKLVGLPHKQYPTLDRFIAYLNQALNAAAEVNNQRLVTRIERVRSAFNRMYRDNSSLFNVYTDDTVDDANSSPQVVYDFSGLAQRGEGIAMAQFLNVIKYATDTLDERDVVILHGVDNLTKSVKPYVKKVFTQLIHRGIRLVFLYDSAEAAIKDADFNEFGYADWTMLGGFNQAVINAYQDLLQQTLPDGLVKSILDYGGTDYGDSIYYLSRGINNVLFALDMSLGTRHGGLLSEHPKGLRHMTDSSMSV